MSSIGLCSSKAAPSDEVHYAHTLSRARRQLDGAAHSLHEIGAPFEARPVSLARKETRTPEFLAINPAGQVPTVLIDGRVLTEVAAILYHLARRHPEARLMPTGDPEAEAQVISWMSFLASTVHPAHHQDEDFARGIYSLADRRLGASEWASGSYSIADIHLFRLFWRFSASLKNAEGTFPNLEAHRVRMMLRPAVIRTLEVESAITA